MSCPEFELLKDYPEEDLHKISVFLMEHGLALALAGSGMSKEDWLAFHKKTAPAGSLDLLKKGLSLPQEDLAKHINPDLEEYHERYAMERADNVYNRKETREALMQAGLTSKLAVLRMGF
jgi:hypothetical protein